MSYNPFFKDLSIGPLDVQLPPSSTYSDVLSKAAAMLPGPDPAEVLHRHAPAPCVTDQ